MTILAQVLHDRRPSSALNYSVNGKQRTRASRLNSLLLCALVAIANRCFAERPQATLR